MKPAASPQAIESELRVRNRSNRITNPSHQFLVSRGSAVTPVAMMQPSRALFRNYNQPFRKLRLTTKDINKGFYKGTRTGSMGRHTKRGGYILDMKKVRTYVVPPGLSTFKVGWPKLRLSWPVGENFVDPLLSTAHTLCLE